MAIWEITSRARARLGYMGLCLRQKGKKEGGEEGRRKEWRKEKKRRARKSLYLILLLVYYIIGNILLSLLLNIFPTILTEQLCTDFFLKCLQEILKCISWHLEVQKGEMIKKATNGTKQAWDGHLRPTSKRVVASSAQPWDKGLVRISHKRDHPAWHAHSCKMQWKLRLISQESMSSFVLREQTVG